MGQQVYGPHNARLLLERILTTMASLGEAAQGIMQNMHWANLAAGGGIVGATGDPAKAAQQAQQAQQNAAAEAQLSARQIVRGLQGADAGWASIQAALAIEPNAAQRPVSKAESVASAAGTTAAPKLALAE